MTPCAGGWLYGLAVVGPLVCLTLAEHANEELRPECDKSLQSKQQINQAKPSWEWRLAAQPSVPLLAGPAHTGRMHTCDPGEGELGQHSCDREAH